MTTNEHMQSISENLCFQRFNFMCIYGFLVAITISFCRLLCALDRVGLCERKHFTQMRMNRIEYQIYSHFRLQKQQK